MKIRIANDHVEDGKPLKAGSTVDLPSGAARSLILRGKAAAVTFHGKPVGQRPAGRRGRSSATAEAVAETSSAAAETKTPPAKGKGKE